MSESPIPCESPFSAVFDAIPTPLVAVDSDGRVVAWNTAMESLTGRLASTVMGKKSWNGFFPSRRPTALDDALVEATTIEDDLTIHHLSGKVLQARISVTPVAGPSRLAAIGSITRASAADSKASEYLHKIPTPVMAVDKQFNVTFMNEAGAKILGMTPQQVVGKKCFDLFRTGQCRTNQCACQQAMDRGEPAMNETVAHPTGLNLPIRYTGAPLRDASGAIIGAVEFITDRSAEEEIARQVSLLVDAAVQGRLDARADLSLFKGSYRVIVEKFNEVLDALTAPLNLASQCVSSIANGQVPELITDNYQGDFDVIKGNLNRCIGIMAKLVQETSALESASAAGDLTVRGSTQGLPGAWLTIVEGMNQMVGQLHDSMTHVADSVDQISSASSQIASGAQAVAEGASQQAGALEETSSAMEEMAGMTQQNAENTRQAKAFAEASHQWASKGAIAMKHMVDAMERIRLASEGTANIIRDINEIAFQTNLLALNAAVEAARAGDAGRGFAVVAEEVRNLAQRAKEASRKTEELIKESVRLSESGQTVANQAASNIDEIAASVSKVSQIVNQIATASEEQTRGIQQVNRSLSEMDQVTQQNAANAEESSSAAAELAAQSQELASMVSNFRLERSTQGMSGTQSAHGPSRLLPKKTNGKKGNGRFHVHCAETDPSELGSF